MKERSDATEWHKIDPGDLEPGHITTVIVGNRALAVARTEDGWGALDNHCPHQGGRSETARSSGAGSSALGMATSMTLFPGRLRKAMETSRRVSGSRRGRTDSTSSFR